MTRKMATFSSEITGDKDILELCILRSNPGVVLDLRGDFSENNMITSAHLLWDLPRQP